MCALLFLHRSCRWICRLIVEAQGAWDHLEQATLDALRTNIDIAPKNEWGWKTILSFWVSVYFQGLYSIVLDSFREGSSRMYLRIMKGFFSNVQQHQNCHSFQLSIWHFIGTAGANFASRADQQTPRFSRNHLSNIPAIHTLRVLGSVVMATWRSTLVKWRLPQNQHSPQFEWRFNPKTSTQYEFNPEMEGEIINSTPTKMFTPKTVIASESFPKHLWEAWCRVRRNMGRGRNDAPGRPKRCGNVWLKGVVP